MKRLLIAALLLACTAAHGANAVQKVADYRIDVRLDDARKMLYGRERLTWRNPSNDVVNELQFHLYLNAFRDDASTFMIESGGRLRSDRAEHDATSRGWIDVKSMSVSGNGNVTSSIRFIHPDTPHPQDRTVIAVPLRRGVGPGESAIVDVTFEAKLPKVFARSGYSGDFFMVGQWFPKIGVYEPAGLRHRTRGGWNCHQYHAFSEFYADYGDYDVTITAASKFVIGAPGELITRTPLPAKTTYRYVSRNVHDFAWTADPRFRIVHYRFDPGRDVPSAWTAEASRLLGRAPQALALQPVEVTMLMQPDHMGQAERYRRALNAVIAFCGLRYGPYPYSTVTLVDPPEEASGASGMEYPGIFTAGTYSVLGYWPFNGIRVPELVTVHEFGHEYWYGMVGSNEFEESWLDEGINSYTEGSVMERIAPGGTYSLPGVFGFKSFANFRARHLGAVARDPIVLPAWKYSSEASWGVSSYARPALALAQIERDLGAATFARCLRAYFERYQYRHPDTEDFFHTFEEVSGRDLSVYRRAFFAVQRFDLRVDAATSVRRGGTFVSDVTVARVGQMPAHAEVLFRFANGHLERRTFRDVARSVHYRFAYRAALSEVVVDPQLKNLWDSDLLNNSKLLDRRSLAAPKVATRLGSASAQLLQLLWSVL